MGSTEVTVRTPSRLHFGIVDMRGDLGRIHGSIGVAIDHPHLLIKAIPSEKLKVEGMREDRVRSYARKVFESAGVDFGADIKVLSDIPEHSGFGSGTQLALAVGAALSELYSLKLDPKEIARKLRRSQISGVGTYAFKYGGFIVDGGHRVNKQDEVPPLIFRSDVPEGWKFVVGMPEIDMGLSGPRERNAFRQLDPPSEELVGIVSRIVLLKMIPAAVEGDIEAFGKAMTVLDYKFGENWMEVQGGRFSHPIIEKGVEFLLDIGVYGAGQSSWGPAFYGLVEGSGQAEEVSERLNEFLNSDGRRGEAFYTSPNNTGAMMKVTNK